MSHSKTTPSKQPQSDPAKNEAIYRDIVDLSPDLIWAVDTKGRWTFINQAVKQIYGYEPAEMLGCPFTDIVAPDQLDQDLHTFQQILAGEKLLQYETKHLHKDGTPVYLKYSAAPSYDEQGNIQGAIGTATNITEYKQTEEALHQSAHKLSLHVQQTPMAYIEWDTEFQVTEWNRAAEAIFGYSKAQAMGRHAAGLIVPDNIKESIDQVWINLLEQRDGTRSTNDNITKDGRIITCEWYNTPLFNQDGQVLGVASLVQDITDRKQLEQALQESEQRWADIIEFLPSPTFAIDKEGKVIAWNRACETTLGIEAKDILGKGDYEYALPFYGERRPILIDLVLKSPEEIEQGYPTIQREGESLIAEAIVYPQGQPRYFVGTASPLYDSQGNLVGAIETFRDITQQKQVEEELRRYQEQLEEQVEARTAELEDRVRELNALQRLMSREGWQTFQTTRKQVTPGYLFDQSSIKPINAQDIGNGHPSPEIPTQPTPSNGHALTRSVAVQGETIGQIGVYDNPEHPLPPEDQEFLDSIAQQVAEALERARLLEQTQKRALELEAVAQVSTVASAALRTDELLQSVVDLTKANFGLYHVHIYLLNNTKDTLVLAAGAGEVGRQMVGQGWSIPFDQEQSLVARAARTRQGIIVNNVRADPNFLPNPLLPDTRSEMAVPLIIGDSIQGVLDVQAQTVNHFTDEDIRIQTTLATQIAVALQNAKLFTQTQAALTETENLYDASRRIIEADSLQEVVAAIAESGPVPVIDRVLLINFVYSTLGEIESMEVVANWHDGAGPEPAPIGTQYTRSLFDSIEFLLSPDPIFFNDVQPDSLVNPGTQDFLQQLNVKSVAVLPLWVGSRQLGAIMLESAQIHHFTEREIQPYITLAGQAAVAIENRRLLDETSRALVEAETAQRRYTLQAWESYRAKSTARNYEHVRDGFTPPDNELPAAISKAVAKQQTTVVTSPSNTAEKNDNLSPQSSLVVPLSVRGEVIGVFGLEETESNREWTPEEVALVEAIAEQISQAAENIRLLDDSQQRAARERRVNEIGEKIQAAQSLEEALQIAVKEVGLSLEAPQTKVQLKID